MNKKRIFYIYDVLCAGSLEGCVGACSDSNWI